MGLFSFFVKVLISRYAIALIEFIIVIPQILAVHQVWQMLWARPDLHEPMDIVSGIGIIMIGLGVVLEERKTLRGIFGLTGGPDESWQERLDESCHHYGVGQLVLGLIAEICIDMIKIPNTIIYTGEVDDYLVAAGCVIVAIGSLLLLKHIVTLVVLMKSSRA